MSNELSLTKTTAQRKHAKKRAEERFGVTLNRDDLRNVASEIRANKCKFHKTISNRVTAWIVRLPGAAEDSIALYDKNRKNVITFLPLDYEV